MNKFFLISIVCLSALAMEQESLDHHKRIISFLNILDDNDSSFSDVEYYIKENKKDIDDYLKTLKREDLTAIRRSIEYKIIKLEINFMDYLLNR